MLIAHNNFNHATTLHARTLLERQIAATDAEIDKLIYGLSEDEVKVMEGKE